MPGLTKWSPGGCHCCPGAACGTVSLPTTLHFTIGGITVSLTGPGGTSGNWQSATGAIHAPGSEISNCIGPATNAYVSMTAFFNLLATANALGQCFTLGISAAIVQGPGSCTPGFADPFVIGLGACQSGGVQGVGVTGVLNSFTWSPFSSAWTFGTSWNGNPTFGSTIAGINCIGPFLPLSLVPPVSGAAILTH
jgi:hypothetical protein